MAHLYCTDDLDGPMNMALDEVLWREAAHGTPFLRLYAWMDRPVISLGYFQGIETVRRVPLWRGLPVVRRLTGGGAIVHDHEITYSLSLGSDAPKTDELYAGVHRAIADSLSAVGVPATLGTVGDAAPADAFLCFGRSDRLAVRVHGAKVLGSAQRRGPESVLMHGSLLLARSDVARDLLGIGDLLGSVPAPSVLRGALISAFARAIQVPWDERDLPVELRQRAMRLADGKYRRREWNDYRAPARSHDFLAP